MPFLDQLYRYIQLEINMSKPLLTAHCLVRNEERWVWYAIMSVIDYVDKILVFDTGSTDNTIKIVKSIKSPKIIFEQKGVVDKKQFTQLRQEMLNRTTTSWFMVLDGDEIWPQKTISELQQTIIKAPKNKQAVVVGQWTCLGDVFHYSVELARERQPGVPDNLIGFRLPRAIKKINGLHCVGEYGYESYADSDEINISDWDKQRLIFLPDKYKYFHMTFLPRSSSRYKDQEVMMRASKTLFYKGTPFPNEISYPEVFYQKRPAIVPSPWIKFTFKQQVTGWFYQIQKYADKMWRIT